MPRAASRQYIFSIAILFHLIVSFTSMAQDMPLSQVLIDGEGWELVAEGYGFTDGLTVDQDGNVYFTDVAKGTTVNKIATDGTKSIYAQNAPRISGLQFGSNGWLYACQSGQYGRIVAFDPKGTLHVIAEGLKPNDLVVTHKGGIYFTETPKHQVTFIPPGGSPVAVDTGVTKPNGIALSPDQTTLAVSDHGGKHVWVWRIETDGTLTAKEPYMTLRTPGPELPSKGDGMTSDVYGRYYVTSAVGIQMFDPTGRMGGVILAPDRKLPIVSVTFAGSDFSDLYVASRTKIYRRKTKSRGAAYFLKPHNVHSFKK